MIYNLFVVPVHDVDVYYFKGMFEVMSMQYSGDINIELRDELKYPRQVQNTALQEHLSDIPGRLHDVGSIFLLSKNERLP